MRRAVAALIVLSAATAPMARPDRNAFLNRRADSIQEVIAQVRRDPAVRDRFQRHYAMRADEIVAFFQTLRPARLERDGLFEIYSVPPDGRIKGRLDTLKRGTRVYVDPNGVPQLVAICANPLSRGPKSADAPNPQADRLWSAPSEELATLGEDPPELVAEWSLTDYTEPAMPELPEGLATADPGTVVLPEAPVPGGGPTVVPLGSGGPGLGWLPGLLVPPALGGGGSRDETGGPIDPVPEPATTALGAAALAAALRASRRRRNR